MEAASDLADRGLPVKVIAWPASLLERIQQGSWQPARGQCTMLAGGVLGYKEKLQVFRCDQREDSG